MSGDNTERPAIALVIFDCDGVLVDSEPICNQVLAEELATIGLAMSPADVLATFVGKSLPQCLALIERHLGHAPPSDFAARYARRSLAALDAQVQAIPGIDVALEALADRRIAVAVASSGSHDKMRTTLGATGLWARLAGRCVSTDDVARPKPAPDVFLAAAARFGAEPSACVVVEDSPTGVRAAVAAGMTVLGFVARSDPEALRLAGATLCFADMADLPRHLAVLVMELNAS